MSEKQRVTIDPEFEVTIPAGWTAEADEDGGVSIAAEEGAGLLSLVAFPQDDGELLDPGEELYVFLEDQGIELEEDEIEDLQGPEGVEVSVCEYTAEDEEEEDEEEDAERATYWLVGVATAPGNLVFCSYSCPAEQAERERAVVREILVSVRPRPRA